MKLTLRLFCLVSLLCASWAVVGADDKQVKKTLAQTAAEAKSSMPKLSGSGTPSASVPAGSSIAVLSAPQPTVARLASAPTTSTPAPDIQLSHGTLAPTPEMWFYEQMRQDENNAELQARRRGEAYAAQRRARMATRAWYGYSNARPTANITPFTYYYSPTQMAVQSRRVHFGIMGLGTW